LRLRLIMGAQSGRVQVSHASIAFGSPHTLSAGRDRSLV
jgi:hypothetical protein